MLDSFMHRMTEYYIVWGAPKCALSNRLLGQNMKTYSREGVIPP